MRAAQAGKKIRECENEKMRKWGNLEISKLGKKIRECENEKMGKFGN